MASLLKRLGRLLPFRSSSPGAPGAGPAEAALAEARGGGGGNAARGTSPRNAKKNEAGGGEADGGEADGDEVDGDEVDGDEAGADEADAEEARRLEALRRYDVLDTPPEESFDRITRLAADYFDVPIAMVSFVDARRQWAKSCFGADHRETGREVSFCHYAIQTPEPLVVEDTQVDARFAENPFVTGPPHVRFYAGMPLATPQGGHRIGTLCLFGTEPRSFGEDEQARLADLAAMVTGELELRRQAAASERAQAAQARDKELAEGIVDGLPGIFYLFDEAGRMAQWNARFAEVTGYTPAEIRERRPTDFVAVPDQARVAERIREAFATGQTRVELRLRAKDGTCTPYLCYGRRLSIEGRPHLAGMGVDLTERKAAEDALHESEERFRTLVERASGIISILAPDGSVRYQSPSVEHILGHAREDLKGGDPFERIHPEDRGRVRAVFASVLEEPGRMRQVQFRTRHADGSWVHLDTLARNLTGDPAIEGIALNSRDVTARKEAETRLRQSEERFREIAETVSEVFWVTSPGKGVMHYVSPAYEDVWGRPREALYEDPHLWIEAIHPEDRERVRGAARTQQVARSYDETYRIRRPDGTVRWVRDRAFPVLGEDGEVERLIGVVQDVTERKRAETALRQSEARHRALVERASDVMVIMEKNGTVRYQSPSVEQVLGRPPSVLEGKNVFEVIHPGDREKAYAAFERSLARRGATAVVQFRTRHADGSWVHMEGVGRNLLGEPAIEGLVVNLRDISDRLQVEAEREARQRAEELLEAKNALLNNMSHELRTPLAAILGFADVLAEEAEDAHREFAQRIATSGQRLQSTLDSVLSLAQIEGGTVDLDLQPVEVAEEVAEEVALLQPVAKEKGLTLTTQAPPAGNTKNTDLKNTGIENTGAESGNAESGSARNDGNAPATQARLDPQALHRILDNLVGNALKFTEEGGVAVTVTADAEAVRIAVRDTGIGIGEDFRPRLFDDFEQESTGLQRTHKGSGLGLAITKRLVELMDGRIEVESTRGVGSCFTVSFPRLAAAAARPPGKAASGEAASGEAATVQRPPAKPRLLLPHS